MKKKLEAELLSIAHRILKLSGRDDLAKLHQEAQKVTEALAILRFYESNILEVSKEISPEKLEEKLTAFMADAPESTPAVVVSESVAAVAETAITEAHVEEVTEIVAKTEVAEEEVKEEVKVEVAEEEVIETPAVAESETVEDEVAEIPETVIESVLVVEKEPVAAPKIAHQTSLEDFLNSDYKDPEFVKVENVEATIKQASEVVFEKVVPAEPEVSNAVEEETVVENTPEPEVQAEAPAVVETPKPVETQPEPVFEKMEPAPTMVSHTQTVQTSMKTETKTLSLNDRLTRGINIGLNDRIAFVKHLFDSNNEDYNRVISQLNTFNSHEEAISFIENMVKPDHDNWEGKEDYAERFLNIIEKKFL
uniref:hypothetical protein n=1 Tax=Flavobacterium sp. TaxID=239 RepID=UPI00404B7B9C